MSTTLTIARREFRSYFDSPLAYVVICLGMILLGVFFFLVDDPFFGGAFWAVGRASLTKMFEYVPYGLAVLIVPVVTMRLLAEEKRSGTLEMLITLPVKDHEVIIGKFLGAWGLVLVLIAATAFFPFMMFVWPWHLGHLDSGPLLTGYLGLALYSAATIAIGLLISTVTESQVIAFFITWLVLVLFQVIHKVPALFDFLGPAARSVTYFISFTVRLEPFTKGVISTREIVFFLSITIGCLMAAFRALERRKWA